MFPFVLPLTYSVIGPFRVASFASFALFSGVATGYDLRVTAARAKVPFSRLGIFLVYVRTDAVSVFRVVVLSVYFWVVTVCYFAIVLLYVVVWCFAL